MTELLKYIYDAGWSHTVYMGFHVMGFLAVFAFVVWFGIKLGFQPWKSVVTVLIVYPVIYAWMYVLFWIESGFTAFGGNNIVRVFIYVPLAGYPVAKMLKQPWDKVCSLLAFAPTVVHGVSHFGCIFDGCCAGYPSSWGIYNPFYGDIRFPSQPLEAIVTLLIIAWLLIRAKKRNYVPDGKEYPLMLLLFGFTRFLLEFLRDNEKMWLGCSNLAFHALFMAIVGAVAIYVINRKQKTAQKAEV